LWGGGCSFVGGWEFLVRSRSSGATDEDFMVVFEKAMNKNKKDMNINDSTLNLRDNLNIDNELKQIWSSYYDEGDNPISPLYQRELRKNTITFLSLNPSLHPKDKMIAKKGFDPEIPYPLIDSKKSKADYPFFQKFYDLGKDFKSWTILDLLYERESNQREIENRFAKKNLKIKEKDFLVNQMKLTFTVLKELKPSLVVVTNAATDKFIHQHLKELNLKQDLPSESNNFVYRLDEIPFIIKESKYLGSRFLERKVERREKLLKEIERVLSCI
jgi:hypothetical protein